MSRLALRADIKHLGDDELRRQLADHDEKIDNYSRKHQGIEPELRNAFGQASRSRSTERHLTLLEGAIVKCEMNLGRFDRRLFALLREYAQSAEKAGNTRTAVNAYLKLGSRMDEVGELDGFPGGSVSTYLDAMKLAESLNDRSLTKHCLGAAAKSFTSKWTHLLRSDKAFALFETGIRLSQAPEHASVISQFVLPAMNHYLDKQKSIEFTKIAALFPEMLGCAIREGSSAVVEEVATCSVRVLTEIQSPHVNKETSADVVHDFAQRVFPFSPDVATRILSCHAGDVGLETAAISMSRRRNPDGPVSAVERQILSDLRHRHRKTSARIVGLNHQPSTPTGVEYADHKKLTMTLATCEDMVKAVPAVPDLAP